MVDRVLGFQISSQFLGGNNKGYILGSVLIVDYPSTAVGV